MTEQHFAQKSKTCAADFSTIRALVKLVEKSIKSGRLDDTDKLLADIALICDLHIDPVSDISRADKNARSERVDRIRSHARAAAVDTQETLCL